MRRIRHVDDFQVAVDERQRPSLGFTRIGFLLSVDQHGKETVPVDPDFNGGIEIATGVRLDDPLYDHFHVKIVRLDAEQSRGQRGPSFVGEAQNRLVDRGVGDRSVSFFPRGPCPRRIPGQRKGRTTCRSFQKNEATQEPTHFLGWSLGHVEWTTRVQ